MKIALIGASGYDNVGDDTYPLLWKQFFPQLEWTVFNSNRPPDGIDSDTGLVLYGGGGLMWYRDGDAHLEYMEYYAEEANRLGIPYGFVSCDFQFDRDPTDPDTFLKEGTIKNWLPVLKRAAFVYLRSPESVATLAERGVDSRFAPDLAYLFRPGNLAKTRELITVVPAGEVADWNGKVKADIEAARERWPDARLVFLNMGAKGNDEEVRSFAQLYPGSTLLLSKDVDPIRVLDIVGRSHIVFSGRYHGMIFSRACGTPYRVYPRAPYKISVEPPLDEIGDAWRNVLKLSNILQEMA